MNETGSQGYISDETVRQTREKLRRIRDSDHPASPWARNVVQCLDDLKERPDDAELLRALGHNVALMERAMGDISRWPLAIPTLTPSEIAAIFGLGGHPGTDQ